MVVYARKCGYFNTLFIDSIDDTNWCIIYSFFDYWKCSNNENNKQQKIGVNFVTLGNVYYIQNQFIPYYNLEFLNPLGEGVFGDVWHAKYAGHEVAVKKAKVAKKFRKVSSVFTWSTVDE